MSSDRQRDNRLAVAWIERVALALAVVFFALHTFPRAWRSLNTDFPNYYLAARLVHDNAPTDRLYDWAWLQREKDHRNIPVRFVSFIPFTPFSALPFYPVAGLSPITAKHLWILFNLALLAPLALLLRFLTGLSLVRIALLLAVCFPLHRNLVYGQQYVFILALVVTACAAYIRGRHALSGGLLAIAAACKIFPALLVFFYLRRRAWSALASFAVTIASAAALSIAAFGWSVHRTWLREVLPWTLRGEGMPPYNTSIASISSVCHSLFLTEPQWNPHPWHASPLAFALLQPTLQILLLAPAILFIDRFNLSKQRVLLEWSALITAALVISTMPASYHFVLLAFPVSVLVALLLRRKNFFWIAITICAFLAAGYPTHASTNGAGLTVLLHVPRLFLSAGLLGGIYVLLWKTPPTAEPANRRVQFTWAVALSLFAVFSVHSALQQQRSVREEFAYRIPDLPQAFLEAAPQATPAGIHYIAFTRTAYSLMTTADGKASQEPLDNDALSFAATHTATYIEQAAAPHSQLVALDQPPSASIDDAQYPALSPDGRTVAFVRTVGGHTRLVLSSGETLTPPSLHVYEASMLTPHVFAIAAAEDDSAPTIYFTDSAHASLDLELGESRYPALSPDAHWLAFSRFQRGNWNLWLRNQRTGELRRLADLPCNQIQPSWTADGTSLLYATDCGRSLRATAISRRRVLP